MNKPKIKGTRFEVAVRDYLATHNLITYRPAQSGCKDVGDLVGVEGWAIECKNTIANDLGSALDEAIKEAENAGLECSVLIKHRQRAPVGRAYAIMTLDQWISIVNKLKGVACPKSKP
jgi:hypothetical protein